MRSESHHICAIIISDVLLSKRESETADDEHLLGAISIECGVANSL
jgi:hypothetical protein